MKIATVTLNPAIDQTVRVDNFRSNRVNRAQEIRFDASGKGVNVASFLADYGYDIAVTGYLGQANVDIFEQFFASKGIDDCFVRIPGNTRINVKVVDEVNQQTTDINMPGQAPPQEAMNTLLETIEQLANSCEWFVLSGSLPPHVPTTIYATIIAQLKRQKKRIILDTSGARAIAAEQGDGHDGPDPPGASLQTELMTSVSHTHRLKFPTAPVTSSGSCSHPCAPRE